MKIGNTARSSWRKQWIERRTRDRNKKKLAALVQTASLLVKNTRMGFPRRGFFPKIGSSLLGLNSEAESGMK